MSIGVPLSVTFTLFSFKPFYRKFMKFLNVSVKYDTLPGNVSSQTRRASVVKLDESVAELLASAGVTELADIVEPIFMKRKPSREEIICSCAK